MNQQLSALVHFSISFFPCREGNLCCLAGLNAAILNQCSATSATSGGAVLSNAPANSHSISASPSSTVAAHQPPHSARISLRWFSRERERPSTRLGFVDLAPDALDRSALGCRGAFGLPSVELAPRVGQEPQRFGMDPDHGIDRRVVEDVAAWSARP